MDFFLLGKKIVTFKRFFSVVKYKEEKISLGKDNVHLCVAVRLIGTRVGYWEEKNTLGEKVEGENDGREREREYQKVFNKRMQVVGSVWKMFLFGVNLQPSLPIAQRTPKIQDNYSLHHYHIDYEPV